MKNVAHSSDPVEGKNTYTLFFMGTHFIRTLRLNLPKNKNMARLYSDLDEKLKQNQNFFEIPQCDSWTEIFKTTQLPKFLWQTNSDEAVNKHQ